MKTVLLLVIGIYVLLCVLVFFTQEYFLFQSSRLEQDHVYQTSRPHEEIWLGEEGRHHAVHIQQPASQGVIIYFHGNRGSLQRWIKLTDGLLRYPYDLLLVEYPGYGKSQAPRSQHSIEELALLSYDYARQNYAAEQVIIYGRSLGTGVASYLAAHRPAKRVVLETPFYSLDDLLRRYLFLLPRNLLIRYHFPNDQWLKRTDADIDILHGTRDQIIPVGMASKLSATLEQAKMTVIDGGRHHNLSDYQQYWDTLDTIFLK